MRRLGTVGSCQGPKIPRGLRKCSSAVECMSGRIPNPTAHCRVINGTVYVFTRIVQPDGSGMLTSHCIRGNGLSGHILMFNENGQ